MDLPELSECVIVSMVLLLAGGVKGVIGLGLPTVSLAILTIIIDLPTAMVIILAPTLVTNIWQAAIGGYAKELLRRLWPFFLTATATILIGVAILTRVKLFWLTALLGVLLTIYAILNLLSYRFTIQPQNERLFGCIAGLLNGLAAGMTGSSVVPGVMYLQAIGLSRDKLIQAMGILFALFALALGAGLQYNQILGSERIALSVIAVFPALVGMVLGRRIRGYLSESLFKRIFFSALLMLGLYLVVSAFNSFIGA